MSEPLDPEKRAELERLALEYLDSLYGLAMWMTRDPADAEDLTQETYLRAFTFLQRFQEGTNLKAWLFTIMRRLFINEYRRRLRHPRPVEQDIVAGEAADEGAWGGAAELTRLRGLVQEDIGRALDALPEEFRTAVILSDLEGLSRAEIAAVMRCPEGTVNSRIARGRRLLRRLLRDYGP